MFPKRSDTGADRLGGYWLRLLALLISFIHLILPSPNNDKGYRQKSSTASFAFLVPRYPGRLLVSRAFPPTLVCSSDLGWRPRQGVFLGGGGVNPASKPPFFIIPRNRTGQRLGYLADEFQNLAKQTSSRESSKTTSSVKRRLYRTSGRVNMRFGTVDHVVQNKASASLWGSSLTWGNRRSTQNMGSIPEPRSVVACLELRRVQKTARLVSFLLLASGSIV